MDKKALFNESFDWKCEKEETLEFRCFEKDYETEEDYLGLSECTTEFIRSKGSFQKDLTLRSKKGLMLGSLTMSIHTDLEVDDSPSFLQQSLDSSLGGGGNSVRGISRDMIKRKRLPMSRSPLKKNLQESSEIELDNH